MTNPMCECCSMESSECFCSRECLGENSCGECGGSLLSLRYVLKKDLNHYCQMCYPDPKVAGPQQYFLSIGRLMPS